MGINAYRGIETKIARREMVILDGGTGTEIQRRGVAMSADTWCAEANLAHPDIVRAVHEEYVEVGADLIIANTFATSPLLFSHLGRMNEVAKIDRAAVSLAREAAQGRVAVAGSFSTMRPLVKGTDRITRQREWSKSEAVDLFKRKALSLADAGVDFIAMEMMRDLDYSLWATEAAVATGLPVWVGLSLEKTGTGKLTGFGRDDFEAHQLVGPLMETGAKVLTIMHTSPNDTSEAIAIAQSQWAGPLGCYPESGYFQMPDWQFVDIIPVAAFLDLAKEWAGRGVTILGGCCGIGPDHIRALVEAFKGETGR